MPLDDQLKRVFEAAMAELADLSAAEKTRAREEGVEAGRAQGWEDGREQGRIEGRSEAEQASRVALDAAVQAARAEASSELAVVDRLLDAARTIDRARSLGEILDTLASCAAREATRAGILLVQDGHLRGWRFIGFDALRDGKALDVPFGDAGILAHAARTGATASGATPGSGGPPRFANGNASTNSLAVPLALAGDVVAVLYADDAGQSTMPAARSRAVWPEALEILARHAARSLESLTAIKAARALCQTPGTSGRREAASHTSADPSSSADDESDAGARRYAKLLVSEIKLYHEGEVAAGRRERDLGTRLGHEIARARVLYEQRVPAVVRNRFDYFHDELVQTLANGDATLLQLT